jgi:hypothetical protein
MTAFPRTTVGGVSVSRMIVGTNWFMGFSHCTPAKDRFIKEHLMQRKVIADTLEVFFRAGVDTVMGNIEWTVMQEAVKDAEDRTGVKGIIVSTPPLPVTPLVPAQGFDMDEIERILDIHHGNGATFIMPHQSATDAMVDRATREVRQMAPVMERIRRRGLIPGLSTHMPETIIYADETGLDCETYISIYNSMGFLMQVEVDWIAHVIRNAKKPVMTIKPMAAGQLRPFQALTFVWNTLREQDMVTVGTMTPAEAQELVDLSLQILDRRSPEVALQETRSKESVKPREG